MKHLLKAYEHEGLTCDMRSSRKTFFPVMKDGKKITDIERSLDYEGNLNINILESLDRDTYNNLFELLSQITNENKVKRITFTSVSKFSRYRRIRGEGGDFNHFADGRYADRESEDFSRHIYGKFMVIKFNDCEKLIDRDIYKQLLDNNIDVKPEKDFIFPRILLGNKTINTFNELSHFYIDDFDKLKDVCFETNSEHKIGDEVECVLSFMVDNKKHDGKIILPKIKSEHKEVTFYFTFEEAKTGKWIDVREDDLDFRNYPNVSSISRADDGRVTFTANLNQEHKNELSL